MKNVMLLSLALLLSLSACQNAQPKVDAKADTSAPTANTDAMPAMDAAYACPMHPEITGRKGDKCSKCKMDLTEKTAMDITYSCPMHAEVTGGKGDKCSKCKMDLTAKPAMDAVCSCPMHPEVTGKKGDKCPKCKMDLTEKK